MRERSMTGLVLRSLHAVFETDSASLAGATWPYGCPRLCRVAPMHIKWTHALESIGHSSQEFCFKGDRACLRRVKKFAAHLATLPLRANEQAPDEKLLDPPCPPRTPNWPEAPNSADDYECDRPRLTSRRFSSIKPSCLRPPVLQGIA